MLAWSLLALVGCPPEDKEDTADTACVPSVRVDPGEVAFGPVGVAREAEEVVTVHNDGCEALELLELSLAVGGQFSVGTPDIVSVPPGSSASFGVTYVPSVPEEATDTIVLTTDDPATPVLEVPVSATGLAPLIDVTPESTDLGEVALPCSEEVELTVTNVGTEDLVVSDLDLISASDDFSLDSGTALPWTLAPGDSTTFLVLYTPTDAYQDDAYVTISSNDPFTPEAQVWLSGGALPECVP